MSAGARSGAGHLGVRGILLAVNVFVFTIPILAIVSLRIFDDQLIRRTEAQLIGQSVLIAEAWRAAWLAEMGIADDDAPRYAPPSAGDDRYFPIEPTLHLNRGVLPPAPEPVRSAARRTGPVFAAGRAVEEILRRSVRMNLSSARILDTDGCVVATSGAELGLCYDGLPEVEAALAGRYAAVLRERVEDRSAPSVESISRHGRVRVHTATPVLADGEVLAVVRMSRTAIDPAKALWFDRNRLGLALAGCALFTGALSLFLSRSIARPLQAITRAARGVVRGEGKAPLRAPRLAPRELRELGQALDAMTTQLQDRADYIAEYAANVSHELKTPITSIRGAAELLEHAWPEMSPAERARFIGNIGEDAGRMQRLVTRLLDLARIQNAPEEADFLELDPFLDGIAESYGDAVRLSKHPLPKRLRVHRDHLECALRNLIDNALRHGAGKPVEVEACTSDEQLVLRVRDHGPGIPERHRDKLYERFFTTERARGGTGLGLSIVHAFAETRGGRLGFETGPGGTCFELRL